MLLFDHLFECCVLLVGLRLSGDVAWDHSLQSLPWLRTITPWICMSLEELHEYALMMCSRFSDDVERQITINMEFCNITRGPPWSAFTADVLAWLRKVWNGVWVAYVFFWLLMLPGFRLVAVSSNLEV